jgi:hypothetical protein
VFAILYILHSNNYLVLAHEVERHLTSIFVTYMVVNRTIRTVHKIIKSTQIKNIKKQLKDSKDKKVKDEVSIEKVEAI